MSKVGSFVQKQTPEGKKFYAELEKLCSMEIQVGFQSGGIMQNGKISDNKSKKRVNKKVIVDSEETLSSIAAVNEYGDGHKIPSRPFMRQSFQGSNKDKIFSFAMAQGKQLKDGKTDAQKILQQMGLKLIDIIQNEIREGGFQENAPYTKKMKNSEQPLIDTGQMRQSVSYVITKKGGGA